jgi:hypothetical protein
MFVFFRDGESVVIRVSSCGKTLEIQENHLPDPMIVPDLEVDLKFIRSNFLASFLLSHLIHG